MAIVLVGVCVNGMVRKNGRGINVGNQEEWGITSPTPCEKCGGKGCPKPQPDSAKPDTAAS